MRLVVLGGGESGTGAALLAKQQGIHVFVSDIGMLKAHYKHLLHIHDIPFEEGGHTVEKIQWADEVIKSPGIPYEAMIIKQIQRHRRHIPIIDEIEFAARYAKGRIIAVTGSNGKSTTAHLMYHLLHAAGYRVALAGNVGRSFAKCVVASIYDHYVLELSSFQLERIKKFKPNIACLLNITPDHLDRYHDSIASYAKAKLNILRNMTALDHFIYDQSDPITMQYLQKKKLVSQLYPIAPSSIDNGLFCFNGNSYSIDINKKQVALLGRHNQYNVMIAIMAAALAGVSSKTIAAALPKFCGLPHRLEWCGAPQGIDCYNDSKSTNVASTTAALLSFDQPIIWIAGGVDKGNDYVPLLPIVKKRVRAIVCLGKENSPILKAFRPLGLPIEERDNLCAAVDIALSIALPGEVILLSPACASFDLFKNFEDRGNQFKAQVEALTQK